MFLSPLQLKKQTMNLSVVCSLHGGMLGWLLSMRGACMVILPMGLGGMKARDGGGVHRTKTQIESCVGRFGSW